MTNVVNLAKTVTSKSSYISALWLKAGFHMIADDRESQIVDRRKFCDRLRSYGNPFLRSFAIVCDPAIVIADDRRI